MNRTAWLGLIIMIVSEAATLVRIEPFWSWNTPIAWTGFILFADSVVWQARHNSWLRSNPREFAFLALSSIPLWLVFEGYNRLIENWYYVGLPENPVLRLLGYAWSFATIWPAIFEGAELISVQRQRDGTRQAFKFRDTYLVTDRQSATAFSAAAILIGAALLVWPLVRPSQYLAAPVWLGFIFLLEPINARLGAESLFVVSSTRNRVIGEFDRLKNLALSGFLCGILWEFWNYWSRAKWHYTVPIMEQLKIFEMPLPGYLGFPAFALECFTMYVFVRMVFSRLLGTPRLAVSSSSVSSARLGRTIAL
jgi:hypothetical protein